MAQPFVLRISDGETTISFLSASYKVLDGGFDISLPQANRELALVREGFYLPVTNSYSYREAKIRFSVYGETRSAVLSALHAIEKVLRTVNNQVRGMAGRRGELAYAWGGANEITYFEVYGGDIQFPSDALSVAKIHAIMDDEFVLSECELTLQLSPMGFGLSIYQELDGTAYEVPLANPYTSDTPTLGGVLVKNGRKSPVQHNYVEIAANALKGTQPLLCKLELKAQTVAEDPTYSRWTTAYVGVKHGPDYPGRLIFDDTECSFASGSNIANADADGGSYRRWDYANRSSQSMLPLFSWGVDNQSIGMFYAFMNGAVPIPKELAVAIGIDDYVGFGIRYQEDYVSATNSPMSLPLGALQLPPTNIDLAKYGTLDSTLSLGLWVAWAADFGGYGTFDTISLLPINNGLRVLRNRVSRTERGSYIDDGWRGIEYFKYQDGANNFVAATVIGLLQPLRLEPGVSQRLYFHSIGESALSNEKNRTFKVRLWAAPTYLTLAM